MNTIADFKRRMILGAKVSSILYYLNKETKGFYIQKDYGIREVSKVQSNSFAIKTDKYGNGTEWVDSWCEWPKKDNFEIIDNNTVKINFGGGYLTYSFLN